VCRTPCRGRVCTPARVRPSLSRRPPAAFIALQELLYQSFQQLIACESVPLRSVNLRPPRHGVGLPVPNPSCLDPAARASGLPAATSAGQPRAWSAAGNALASRVLGRADPRRGHLREQGGRRWADAGGWDCVNSGCMFLILATPLLWVGFPSEYHIDMALDDGDRLPSHAYVVGRIAS
jgi:hypothetical protein